MLRVPGQKCKKKNASTPLIIREKTIKIKTIQIKKIKNYTNKKTNKKLYK